MRAVEIIMKKRDGGILSAEEIRFLVDGYVRGEIPDYQVASWLMAVFQRGMTPEETAVLTRTMIDSGEVLDLGGLSGPLVDKHSTGGVGDKISLILAPVAAACGLQVPMMSGRALGHTGGTLDKLDSIPGYTTSLDGQTIRRGLREVGFIMTGQSEKVVPADRLMYALRDVTATVESIPLITASILSKKFAEGAQALVFDVKFGRGAFMKSRESARALADSLVSTGRALGRKVVALLTDMSTPLGVMTGNFLEVEESVRMMEDPAAASPDLMELTLRQAGWMLVAGGLCSSVEEGEERARQALFRGSALTKFWENVALQGGRKEELKSQLGVRRAPYHGDLRAPRDGWVTSMDTLEIGLAGVALGVGRSRKEDPVLPDVGFEFFRRTGAAVKQGEPLVRVWAQTPASLEETLQRLAPAFEIGHTPPASQKLIAEEITAL